MNEHQLVAADGAPLSFRVPPGWPAPSEMWVYLNQAWMPPTAAWVPRANVPAPPLDWEYWAPTPVFDELRREVAARHRRRVVGAGTISALLFIVGFTVPVMFFGAFWAGWVCSKELRAMAKSAATARTMIRMNADEERPKALRVFYEAYLAREASR